MCDRVWPIFAMIIPMGIFTGCCTVIALSVLISWADVLMLLGMSWAFLFAMFWLIFEDGS